MGVTFGLALLLLALGLALLSARLRRRSGIPWAPVVYRDTDARELDAPLFAKSLGLTGKPDYLIERRGKLIPIEVKPGRLAAQPYESDLMQLAAYCVLVEEDLGLTPPYGLLRYAERTFQLDFTPQVRERVIELLGEMRALLDADDCERSHNDARRCGACGLLEQCEDALDTGA